jgi:hypothetical protein
MANPGLGVCTQRKHRVAREDGAGEGGCDYSENRRFLTWYKKVPRHWSVSRRREVGLGMQESWLLDLDSSSHRERYSGEKVRSKQAF